jgi:hypothetical protein
MELEKMKTLWQEMSEQIEEQKQLTDTLIMDMTQQKYTQKFNKITTYESIGAAICFITAILILVNFKKLDTWYLAGCGIFTLSYLLTLPILVLRSLKTIRSINISSASYKESIVGFAKAKKQLLLIQKLGMYVNFILFLAIIPVTSKLMGDKDIFMTGGSLWKYGFIAIVAIAMIFVSRWGYGCYKNITNSAENILKELED